MCIARRLPHALWLGISIAACGPDPSTPADGGGGALDADATDGICDRDTDCDDGLYCNGAESCAPDDADAGTDGCVAGEPPCSEGCDEDLDACGCDAPDADGDGAARPECGGDDCDDDDPRRYPGAEEICDPDHVDEDCDPTTFGFRDADADGAVDAACCNVDADGTRAAVRTVTTRARGLIPRCRRRATGSTTTVTG